MGPLGSLPARLPGSLLLLDIQYVVRHASAGACSLPCCGWSAGAAGPCRCAAALLSKRQFLLQLRKHQEARCLPGARPSGKSRNRQAGPWRLLQPSPAPTHLQLQLTRTDTPAVAEPEPPTHSPLAARAGSAGTATTVPQL
jgi:hypothetical protein